MNDMCAQEGTHNAECVVCGEVDCQRWWHVETRQLFIPYNGQEPPPWTPAPVEIPWHWGRRRLRRLIAHQQETIAWERWKLDKVINDYGLHIDGVGCDMPAHNDRGKL